MQANIGKEHLENVMKNPLIFVNFMLAEPLDAEIENPRIYEEIKDYSIV